MREGGGGGGGRGGGAGGGGRSGEGGRGGGGGGYVGVGLTVDANFCVVGFAVEVPRTRKQKKY